MGAMKTPGVYIVEKMRFPIPLLRWLLLFRLLSDTPKKPITKESRS